MPNKAEIEISPDLEVEVLEWWVKLSKPRKDRLFQKVAEKLLLDALRPMIADVLPETVKDEVQAYVRQVLEEGWRDNSVDWGRKVHIEDYIGKLLKADIGNALQRIQMNVLVTVQKSEG